MPDTSLTHRPWLHVHRSSQITKLSWQQCCFFAVSLLLFFWKQKSSYRYLTRATRPTTFTARQHIFWYACKALYLLYSKSVRPYVCLSVRPFVCHTLALCQNDSSYIMWSSLENSPMTSFLTVNFTAKFQRKHIGSEDAEWERGRKNRLLLANKSTYLRNGARQDHSHNGDK